MIIGVFGPRDFHPVDGEFNATSPSFKDASKRSYYNNYQYIGDCLDDYSVTKVITGGGFGVEQLALRYAVEQSIEHEVVPPNLAEHGNEAFPIRNRDIVGLCDIVVVFWDGRDKFYFPLFTEAVKQGKLLHVRHME